MPKMSLPVPTPEQVERYREIFLELYGLELSDAQALDQCSRLAEYVFLTEHARPALRELGEEG